MRCVRLTLRCILQAATSSALQRCESEPLLLAGSFFVMRVDEGDRFYQEGAQSIVRIPGETLIFGVLETVDEIQYLTNEAGR